ADQHDVHHHNSADDQRNKRDRSHNCSDASRKLVDLIVDLLDVDGSEIVILVAFELVMDAHRQPALLERSVKLLPVVRFAVHLNALKPAKDPAECRDRNVPEIVERVTKHRPSFLLHTDDTHREAANLERFVDRIDPWEEFFTQFVPNNDDISGSVDFIRPDKSAIGDRLVFNLGHVRGDTRNICSEKLLAVLFNVDSLLNFGPDFFAQRAILKNPLKI